MSKRIYNNSINALLIMGILIVTATFALPNKAKADFVSGGGFYSLETDSNVNDSSGGYTSGVNPVPVITSLSPNSVVSGSGVKTIAINGKNFVPNSVAKIGSQERPTSYVNSNRLLMQLSSGDVNQSGEFLITVWNPEPAGGYSNPAFFTITKSNKTASTTGRNSSNNTGIVAGANTESASNGLGANAIGSGIKISGIMLWLIIAILILIVVMLWRKIFGEKERNKPLKHA